jgi:BlaI family penicillinase repressor
MNTMATRPKNENSARFGRLQMRIMRLLWMEGKLSARQITDRLNKDRKHPPTAHSTVQTLLRQLEQKEAVSHEVHNRTFVFRPLIRQENALRRATREFVERIFAGSTQGLVAHLIESESIPPEELEAIQQLIRKRRKGTK